MLLLLVQAFMLVVFPLKKFPFLHDLVVDIEDVRIRQFENPFVESSKQILDDLRSYLLDVPQCWVYLLELHDFLPYLP